MVKNSIPSLNSHKLEKGQVCVAKNGDGELRYRAINHRGKSVDDTIGVADFEGAFGLNNPRCKQFKDALSGNLDETLKPLLPDILKILERRDHYAQTNISVLDVYPEFDTCLSKKLDRTRI